VTVIDRRAIPDGMAFQPWYAPDGWPHRAFAWPAARPKGSIAFLGGRGDFVEKYLEALAHWQAGGWSVAGFDWRGQGGSGRFLADPLVCHSPGFDPLVADLAAWLAEWADASPAPHAVVAHSMGAHLLLRAIAEQGAAPDRIVLLSPMIGIGLRHAPGPVVGLAARAAVALGRGERRIWEGDLGNYGGRMSSSEDRQADKAWWKAARPDIASGAPSWGWLAAASTSTRKLPPRALAAVATPALLIASQRDPVIEVSAVRRAAAALPHGELLLLPGAGHELLREADERRLPVLARIDAFLAPLLASADRRVSPPPHQKQDRS
jgi:lysophospholipase